MRFVGFNAHQIKYGVCNRSVTTGQETSQNHRLKTSQSDQRAHLCVLCCLTKHINPFRDFKTKICGAPIIK